MIGTAPDPTSAERLRERLVEHLIIREWIRTPKVERAFRNVPREAFVPPGTALEVAYADDVVVTQRGPDGKATSSVSAPWLQAYMLEEAGLRPGDRVLEIGGGGYNAALAADVVGSAGAVVSLDIDPEIAANARAALPAAGYPQVSVVCADGEYGYEPDGPYDAIIVTVNAVDIPPAWVRQLTPSGRLVVPLRMRGHTRCLTLVRQGDHLAATSTAQCGFVAMQGEGRSHDRRFALHGDAVVLLVDDTTTAVDADALAAALHAPRVEVWSPVTVTVNEGAGFESLQLWLASQPRPYGVLVVDRERVAGLVDPQDKFTCPALLGCGGLAYLTMQKLDEKHWQFGAHGFGTDAGRLTADLVDLIAIWDRDHRHGSGPVITVHPAGPVLPDTDQPRLVVPRRHALAAVTWPGGGPR